MVQWYGAHRPAVMGARAMVSSTHYLATTAGVEILKAGGNAIDAAVTAAAVLNVVEPMMTGMGGDLFALFWSVKDKRLVGLNAITLGTAFHLVVQAVTLRFRLLMLSSNAPS